MFRTCSALSIILLAACAFAGTPDRIPAGYDAWITVGGGATFMSFDEEPIPADFFCEGSQAFDGRIHFEGVPLSSDPPGRLGASDTIVERVDDAVFQDGTAISRVRVKAIHLAGREEIANGCGVWAVRVGLTEEQPTTTIEYNQVDAFSGTFNAELVLNVKMVFTNIDDPADERVLTRTVHLTEFNESPYNLRPATDVERRLPTTQAGKRVARQDTGLRIDTDADGLPDTVLAQIANTNNWHYYNGYVCPIGVYPPSSQCSLWRQVHQAPTHAHVTLPGAPPNPCARLTPYQGVETLDRLDTTERLDYTTISEVELTPVEAYPCPTVSVGLEINNLRGQLEQLEEEGRLIVPIEEVIGDLLRKVDK